MLEWYRTDAPYEALWDDCAAILRIAAETSGHTPWTFRGKVCDPLKPPGRRTVEDAFAAAGIGLGETLTETSVDRDALATRVRDAGIQVGKQDSWSDIFSRVIVEKVEPRLGLVQPDILYRYPANEAALARPDPLDPRWAERFELYACGVELANGFGELIDAGEQRRRFESWMAEKSRIYGERYPIDEDFLAALAKMPPASGLCARLRPAGDAGRWSRAGRSGHLDAACGWRQLGDLPLAALGAMGEGVGNDLNPFRWLPVRRDALSCRGYD